MSQADVAVTWMAPGGGAGPSGATVCSRSTLNGMYVPRVAVYRCDDGAIVPTERRPFAAAGSAGARQSGGGGQLPGGVGEVIEAERAGGVRTDEASMRTTERDMRRQALPPTLVNPESPHGTPCRWDGGKSSRCRSGGPGTSLELGETGWRSR